MKPIPSHELVGARMVGELPSADMVDLWVRISSGIVKYGFVIEYRDLDPPRTGIFDGLRITIDPDVGFEMQCFLLLHLFGHSVQWVAPSLAQALGELQHTRRPVAVSSGVARLRIPGRRVRHAVDARAGSHAPRPVVQRFRRDRLALRRALLQTDRIPPWTDCIVTGCRLIQPAPIPPLALRAVDGAIRVLSGKRHDETGELAGPGDGTEMAGLLEHGPVACGQIRW